MGRMWEHLWQWRDLAWIQSWTKTAIYAVVEEGWLLWGVWTLLLPLSLSLSLSLHHCAGMRHTGHRPRAGVAARP